jgi:hypothetical protein
MMRAFQSHGQGRGVCAARRLARRHLPEWETADVKSKLIAFGQIEIEGQRYERDVVIDAGCVRLRKKGPSKALRDQYSHTPLTAAENIPWGGRRLIVGLGEAGALPITPDVYAEAARRGIDIDARPTREACRVIAELEPEDVFAVLHVTC